MAPFRAAGPGGRDGGQLVRAMSGVAVGRPPPAVATALRRSGQTRNGASSCGRVAPARRAWPFHSRSTLVPDCAQVIRAASP
jgi:hypothetical protein